MKLALVTGDDWEGLYVNGQLAVEGHKVSVRDALCAIGHYLDVREADNDWLDDRGCLPENWTSVKFSS
jgi:hypothetical protein